MKKYLITGFSGFVSYHFLSYLNKLKIPALIKGLDIIEPEFDVSGFEYVKCEFEKADLLRVDRLKEILKDYLPDYILHLASYSSVAYSWENPVESFKNNTNIYLNIIETVRKARLDCRILSIGSSEMYGDVGSDQLPLREDNILKPVSPYAVARVAQELISKIYVDSYGLDIVMTRSFNHIGPGQKDIFVVSSFAKQIAAIKKYNKNNAIKVGDISIIRDFTDVRDVVSAYYLLLQKGGQGQAYNICSGSGFSLGQVINVMGQLMRVEFQINIDRSLIRPNDNHIIVGSNDKIKKEIGWEPSYRLDQSLNDILNYWYQKV